MPIVTGMVQVFILAENRLLREALTRILNKKNDIRVVGASAFVPEIVPQIAAANPDVLLSDSAAVALSDLRLLPEVRAVIPSLRVVMVGMEADRDLFLRAVREGIVGYVLKDASAADVISGVRSVGQGHAVCPPQLCMSLFRAVTRQWTSLPSARIKIELGLTRRQQQLVPLIAQGFTNKEIASHLNISEQTVKNHIHRMLRRVGASDRLEVIDLTRTQGIFP